jgi:hypothetical protein
MYIDLSFSNINTKAYIIDIDNSPITSMPITADSGYVNFKSNQNVTINMAFKTSLNFSLKNITNDPFIKTFTQSCLSVPKKPIKVRYEVTVFSKLLEFFKVAPPTKDGEDFMDCPDEIVKVLKVLDSVSKGVSALIA